MAVNICLFGHLFEQLWSIYTAGNTVPIPFLRATDISPIALLSDNVLGGWPGDSSGSIAVEAMHELFSGDAQPRKGRSRQNEVCFILVSMKSFLFPCNSFDIWVIARAPRLVTGTPSPRRVPEIEFQSDSDESCSGVSIPQDVRISVHL